MEAIGNSLGKYIDRFKPKAPKFACARICVEVDMDKGIPQAINIWRDGSMHF